MASKLKTGIITPPRGEAATTPLSNLASIIDALADELHIVTGGEVQILPRKSGRNTHVHRTKYVAHSNVVMKIVAFFLMQLRFSFSILKLSQSVNVWFFFLDGETLFMPILVAKVLKKRIVTVLAASFAKTSHVQNDFLSRILGRFSAISFLLSDRIIVYSARLIKEWNLEENRGKILVAHEHFVDFGAFERKNRIGEKENLIGYIGRISEEKGILNLVKAVPLMIEKVPNILLVICGTGDLSASLNDIVESEALEAHISFSKWIPHRDVPQFLNRLRLLIIPSFTEGLPNVLLEAMACGTPVLATPVGAIPDVIKEGETGFLLTSNDPGRIANKTVELLNEPEILEEVGENAYNWVRENFNEEVTIRVWQRVLNNIK